MKRTFALALALTLVLSLAVPLAAVAADLFFIDTVDTPPVLEDTQAPGTWFVGVATGMDFPDALAAGAGVGARNGVLLLTQKDAPTATRVFVQAHEADVATLQVFGGPAVVSDGVLSDLLARAGIVLP
ncbi:MAG: cell wall-binding repeat-containing protein [Coriobacteriia bacterium]